MDSIKKNFLIFSILLLILSHSILKAEEEEIALQAVADQIQVLTKDLKTLEKAVYKNSDITNTSQSFSSNNLNEDIMAKHLLKLNEIEDQFRELTNRFEEVNFKLDKLSNRVSKIQSDTQLRFSDLESGNNSNLSNDSNFCSAYARVAAPTYICRNPLMCAPEETSIALDALLNNAAAYDLCMLKNLIGYNLLLLE